MIKSRWIGQCYFSVEEFRTNPLSFNFTDHLMKSAISPLLKIYVELSPPISMLKNISIGHSRMG
jgi:hypothetical protein